MAAQTERPPLTAHIETWTGQDVSIVSMTHEVVSRLLLGAVEVVNGDTEDVRAHHAVGAAGQTHPVQCPVQRAGEEAELRAQRARGCKTGAYTQDRVLRGDHCYIWVVDKHTGTHWYQLKKTNKKKITVSSNPPILLFMSWFYWILSVKNVLRAQITCFICPNVQNPKILIFTKI